MRVLLLAYNFPPVGGGGSQRSLKFARYLPELGYDVIVLTGPGTPGGRWSPADESLLAELPGADIHRLRDEAPRARGGWHGRAERWLGLASPWTRWWVDGVVRAGTRLAKDGDADVVLASMSPFETAVAAARLSRELGLPWVADLRDPWALDEMTVYPTRLHQRREVIRMGGLLGTAAGVVANTPESAHRIREAFPALSDIPVVAIPNGFDSGDFADTPPAVRSADTFRIVHTGHLHTELGRRQHSARFRRLLGGSVAGVDILARSHVYLLEAIDLLIERDPGLRSRIEVLLAGVLSGSDLEVAGRYPVVRALGYLPHDETIRLMRSADLLFLPMYKLPPGRRSGIVPGKTYEYLAAQRPILATVPQGDARDLLVEAGSAHLCEPDDVHAIAAAIEGQITGEDARPARVPTRFLERFERRSLTAQLATVLDGVTGAPPARRPRTALVA